MAELTGKHVLAITVGAFGVIIAVNVLMAVKAVSTFPGLEVENSYVASQSWDREMSAQRALGWTLTETYDPGTKQLRLRFADRDGAAVQVQGLRVLVGRPTASADDLHPQFLRQQQDYVATAALTPGKWMLHVTATAPNGVVFRHRLNLLVKG